MGCGCFSAKSSNNFNSTFNKTNIVNTGESRDVSEIKLLNDETFKIKVNKNKKIAKNYLYAISPQNWLKILDFLNYTDLKEGGKANRYIKRNIFKRLFFY